MRRRGWSQGDVARAIGCDSGLVNRWLHGHRPVNLKFAVLLQQKMGIDPELWTEPPSERLRLRKTA